MSNDALNAAANTNVCMPSSPGGSVSMPTNGVVYVEDCVNSATCTTASPMAPTGSIDPGEEGVTTQNQNSVGDAIVQGSVTNPMTIGTSNNIIIDGNLCYTDDVSGGTCTASPTSPVDQRARIGGRQLRRAQPSHGLHHVHGSESITGNAPTTARRASATARPLCDLSNPIIDAVILALKGSFLVNYWDQGSVLGANCPVPTATTQPTIPNCITLNGTIDQAWRGAVGTGSPSVSTGYAKNYQWDSRLAYLSPPYYLNPGTSQWGFASFTNVSGSCKMPDRPDLSHRVPVSRGPTGR